MSMKYELKLVAQDGSDSITTILTNLETEESREEQWEREEGYWIWQNGWGDAENGLYRVLFENDERVDRMLSECESSFTGIIEFEI